MFLNISNGRLQLRGASLAVRTASTVLEIILSAPSAGPCTTSIALIRASDALTGITTGLASRAPAPSAGSVR